MLKQQIKYIDCILYLICGIYNVLKRKIFTNLTNLEKHLKCTIIHNIQYFTYCTSVAHLIGFWPFNSKYGGEDISVNRNRARMVNVTYREGPFTGGLKAYKLKGRSNSYIRIPKSPVLSLNESFTILIYLSPKSKETGPIIEYRTGQARGLHLWLWNVWNSWLVGFEKERSRQILIEPLRPNRWYFLGYSYNHSSTRITAWMDGETLQSWTLNIRPKLSTDGDIFVGLGGPCGTITTDIPWYGRVACLMMYDNELSRAQVVNARQQCLYTFYGKKKMQLKIVGNSESNVQNNLILLLSI